VTFLKIIIFNKPI